MGFIMMGKHNVAIEDPILCACMNALCVNKYTVFIFFTYFLRVDVQETANKQEGKSGNIIIEVNLL